MDWEDKKAAFDLQEYLFDRVLLFTNPAAFKDFSQTRDSVKRGENTDLDDIVNLPSKRASKPILHDEEMAKVQARMRLRRSPTIGGSKEEFEQQSDEELLQQEPLKSVFSAARQEVEKHLKEVPLVPLDQPSSRFEA